MSTVALTATTRGGSTTGTVTVASTWNGKNAWASPSIAGWPDATNTGVPTGTSLTASGSITTSASGQVIDSLSITGTVVVNHPNVVIKRCKITAPGGSSWAITSNSTGLTVQDCTIDSGKSDQGAIVGDNFTALRNNIYNGENAVRPGSNCLVQDNWMHTFRSSSSAPHYDCIEVYGGTGTRIVHNTLDLDQTETSCVNIQGDFGPVKNVTVDRNLVRGGGWTFNIRSIGANPVTGTIVTNNRFGLPHAYGWDAIDDGTYADLTGNVTDADGLPLAM